MKKEFTCIVCPMSCALTVEEGNGEILVMGNGCKRGQEFGINEFTNPKRMVTTTVKVTGSHLKRLPVISTDELPLDHLFVYMHDLYQVILKAPIEKGQIIIENIGNTGVDIVASRSLKQIESIKENA
jgi:CxxC motif-containing protein